MAPSPATARRPEPLTDPEAGELIARRLAAQLAAIGPAAVAAPGEVSPGTGALPALADQRVAARVRVELPRYADGVAASAAAEERALSTERVAAAESAEAN